jgi:uncharacterized protein YndB with AHSA1/START domain
MSGPIAMRLRVGAPAGAVLHALTDPVQLQAWFCEHADIALPHRYGFWGRDIPWGTAPRQRLLHVDDRLLRIAWLLPGDATAVVEIRLRDEPDGSTTVLLSQTEVGDPAAEGTLHALWTLALANLTDHLDGRRPLCRYDFTTPEMRIDVAVDAPASAVYESLLATDLVTRSFTFARGFDPRSGGTHGSRGRLLTLEPDRRVTIEIAGRGATTFRMGSADGGTALTLIEHPAEAARPSYAARARALSTLAEVRRFHERGRRRQARERPWGLTVGARTRAVITADRTGR